jgi:hypothetical protein
MVVANKEATEPGFLLVNLKSSLRKFYGHHHDLVNRFKISLSQMTMDTGMFRNHYLSFLIHDLSTVCN